MPTRHATAVWKGNLTEGGGSLTSQSGALNGSYTRPSRFEDGAGTNPEELLGAAHAGCFSMQVAATLSRQGFTVNSIETTAHVHLEKNETGFAIARIDLVTRGSVEGIDQAKFQEVAESAKTGCIISRALSAVPMTLDAQLI